MILNIIAISLWIATVVGFIIWNLYQKNVKMEKQLLNQQLYIAGFQAVSKELDMLVNKVDTTIWVQSDPELLQLFETMKNLNALIKQYNS